MKHLLIAVAACLLAGGVTAQDAQQKESAAKATSATMEKTHACNEHCKDGRHAYMHGEKGHECTKECMAMHADKAHDGHGHATKEHVCSEACTKEKHAYACGEKGHVCSAECHKQEMKEKKADM
ncbi:MAG: hypothetical protein KDC02_19005 [Flavobacteriales bacterium]|nr:hypothetical protein [Flavobacteriales bacterium]